MRVGSALGGAAPAAGAPAGAAPGVAAAVALGSSFVGLKYSPTAAPAPADRLPSVLEP